MRDLLILDLDDTLIRTSRFYWEVRKNVTDKLTYLGFDVTDAIAILEEVEARNIKLHGFSKERFPLSLSELYSTLCTRQMMTFSHHERHKFEAMGWGVYDVAHPHVDGALETLHYLREAGYNLALLTKGDREVQFNKIKGSDLSSYFDIIHIVPDKKTETYIDFVTSYGLTAEHCHMIGDSIKSDVNPAIRAGLNAIYIPSPDAWCFEVEPLLPGHTQLESITQLRDLFKRKCGDSVDNLHNI
jgi:putative hydrolase of the HAD superfamily